MQSLFDMYTLEAHMAEYDVELTEDDKAEIADTAAAFIADNSKDALDALGADEETVERSSDTGDDPEPDAHGDHCGCRYQCDG